MALKSVARLAVSRHSFQRFVDILRSTLEESADNEQQTADSHRFMASGKLHAMRVIRRNVQDVQSIAISMTPVITVG